MPISSSLVFSFLSLLGSRLLIGFQCNYLEYFTFLVGDGRFSPSPLNLVPQNIFVFELGQEGVNSY